MSLKGKVALVTGAGSGIGEASVLRLASEGAKVVLVGRRKIELDRVAAVIRERGGEALVHACDISHENEIESLMNAVERTFGGLDIAFNNAGVLGSLKPITELSAHDFDEVMNINLRGVWMLIRAEVRLMKKHERQGSIINTSSFVARSPNPGASIYAASKAALDSIIKAVALEVGSLGIRINNISPGVVQTAMNSDLDPKFKEMLAAQTALKRLGAPDEIAEAVSWLAGEGSRYMTGETINVDGGITISALK